MGNQKQKNKELSDEKYNLEQKLKFSTAVKIKAEHSLSTANKDLKASNAKVEAHAKEIANQKQKIKELLDEISKLKSAGGNTDTRVKQLEKDVAKLKAALGKRENEYESLQKSNKEVVASEKKLKESNNNF